MGIEYSVRANGIIPLKDGIRLRFLRKIQGFDLISLDMIENNSVAYEYEYEGKSLWRAKAAQKFLEFVEKNYARDAWVEHYEEESDYGCFDRNSLRGPRDAVIKLRLNQIEEEFTALAREQKELLDEQRASG